MTRYLCVWLPALGIESVRRGCEDSPTIGYAKVKNALRVVALNAAARQAGLRAGLTLAEARAMRPGVDTLAYDQAAEAETLTAITAWSRRFTPLAAPDPPDGITLDISGVTHLFGGESQLAQDVESRLAAQGFSSRLAVAPTPEAAWGLARFGARAAPDDPKGLLRAVSSLPLAALRLDTAAITSLRQAGLRVIGDIAMRPRAPLTARFGSRLFSRFDAMMGTSKTPITPLFEAPPYLAERRFAEGLARREDIESVIAALAADLAQLLERHGEGARRLDLTLFRVDGVVKNLEVGTSRPQRDPAALARLFGERIEALGEHGLETGYGFDLIRLAALAVEPLALAQPALPEREAGRVTRTDDFADLVDRLGARLGPRRVTRLVAQESHIPEAAAVAVAYGTAVAPARKPALLIETPDPLAAALGPARPLRLFETPERIEALATVPDGPPAWFRWRRLRHDVVAVEGPERIAPEWWKAAGLTRDYFRVEDQEGGRFWVFREGLAGDETAQMRWFLHGLFA